MNCPSCHQMLEEDFGVITCPHCGAVMMVGMDGHVQISPSESQSVFEGAGDSQPVKAGEFDLPQMESIEFESAADEPLEQESPEEVFRAQELVAEVSSIEVSPAEEWASDSGDLNSSAELDSFFNPTDAPSESSGDMDSVDITSYAESESSSGREGLFLYDFFVVRRKPESDWEDLFTLLEDDRFRVDVVDLRKSMSDDQLIIKNFGPAKASVFLNRLNLLDFNVTWKQKHLFKGDDV